MKAQACAVALLAAVGMVAAKSSSQLPNLVLLVIDDAGWNDVGFHNDDFSTPSLDKLASDGVKTEGMYTDRECTPSRAQLLTGMYTIRTGMQDGSLFTLEPRGLPLEHTLLPEMLQGAGYATFGVGKWHLGHHQESYCPWSRGFDRYFGNMLSGGEQSEHTQSSETWYMRDNTLSSGDDDEGTSYDGFYLVDATAESGFVSVGDQLVGMHSTDLYTNKSIAWLDSFASDDTPFFLYLSYQAVHTPLEATKLWLKESGCSDAYTDNRETLCAMMSQLDFGAGNLVSYLKERNWWGNTVLVAVSDNGGHPDHGGDNTPLRGYKGQYWDGGVKSPVVWSGGLLEDAVAGQDWDAAGVDDPHTNTDLMHITDIAATLLTLAGVSTDGLDGVDQWSALTVAGTAAVREEVLINVNSDEFGGGGALRVGQYKYLVNPEPHEDLLVEGLLDALRTSDPTDADTVLSMINTIRTAIADDTDYMTGEYLFDLDANPYEVDDGSCSTFAECNNLVGESDYSDVLTEMRTTFASYAAQAVTSTAQFQRDGPMVDPANLGGALGVPWRDTLSTPYGSVDLSFAWSSSSASSSIDDADDPGIGVEEEKRVHTNHALTLAMVLLANVSVSVSAVLFTRWALDRRRYHRYELIK